MCLKQGKLKCSITGSDRSETMSVRVSLFDAENNYYAPDEALFYGHSFANGWPADWGIKGDQKYFYARGKFELSLPCKKITLKISHGFEYETFEHEITIKPGCNIFKIELKRIIKMSELGWYCGDNHSHFNHAPLDYELTEQEGLFCASAEGLDFICFLNKNLTQPLSIETKEVTAHFSYECGHHPVLNTGICLPQGLSCALKDHGDWFSLNDWVHENTDGIIIMGHPLFVNHLYSGLIANDFQVMDMTHYEIPINTILGKVDTFELQNNRLSILKTWLGIWYRLLNCGINLPMSAGTDACISINTTLPLGVYRSYVQAEDNNFDAYLAGLKAGHSFLSDGPLLFFKVNGMGPGESIELDAIDNNLQIRIQVKSIFPLPGVELIQDGKVIMSWELNGENKFNTSFELQINKSCFLALRVLRLREKTDNYEVTELFAHTNPVFIYYDGKCRSSSKDAIFFLQWIEVIKKYRLGAPDADTAAIVVAEATKKYLNQLNHVDTQRWSKLKKIINNQDIHALISTDKQVINESVILKKTENETNNIVFKTKSIELESDCFYKISAKIKKTSSLDKQNTVGGICGKLIFFDEIGNYLGTTENKIYGVGWHDISTLIYLPAEAKKMQIAYSLSSLGEIEFKDIIINRLKDGLFSIA